MARHPKIVVSCAHVTFDNGAWLGSNKWVRKWHSSKNPSSASSKIALRGYWYWTEYGASEEFQDDFVVFYAYDNLAKGSWTGWIWNDDLDDHPLLSSRAKIITGYPSSDSYYMNFTGPFSSAYQDDDGYAVWNPFVKGGNGMSGGGVFAYDEGYDEFLLAGVHVSGAKRGFGAGARALDSEAASLMERAMESAEDGGLTVTRAFSNTNPAAIPDDEDSWTKRKIKVSGMPKPGTALFLSLVVSHSFRGDLEVKLKSPAGRTLLLKEIDPADSADDVVFDELNISSAFAGQNPNGEWTLCVRDLTAGDVGRIEFATLIISAKDD